MFDHRRIYFLKCLHKRTCLIIFYLKNKLRLWLRALSKALSGGFVWLCLGALSKNFPWGNFSPQGNNQKSLENIQKITNLPIPNTWRGVGRGAAMSLGLVFPAGGSTPAPHKADRASSSLFQDLPRRPLRPAVLAVSAMRAHAFA